MLVKLRFSELNPGQVTGYSVALPGHAGDEAEPVWYGGGRLADRLSLPRLRRRWSPGRSGAAGQRGASGLTGAERNAILEHAARQAGAAAEHIRWCALRDPAQAADAAHAAADALHVAARITGSETLRRAADAYDRAARLPYGRIPRRSPQGRSLRTAAWLLAMAGRSGHDSGLRLCGLAARLADLTIAVAELRQAQQHAAQAAAARTAATRLRDEISRMRSASAPLRPAPAARPGSPARASAAAAVPVGAPAPAQLGGAARDGRAVTSRRRRGNSPGPSRASPKR